MNENILEWFNRRERQILVHSCLYYRLDTNIISDDTYDRWSKELAEAIEEHPETFKKTVYYKEYKEFDGSTGYNLPSGLPDIVNRAMRLAKYTNIL